MALFNKALLKKKKFWVMVAVIVIIALILIFSRKSEALYVTEKAVIGDLKQTVEVTGSVESAQDIDLNFNNPGTLQAMSVKAGDQVKAGQVLASLSAGNAASQVADARAAVQIAQSDLDKLIAGASSEDIRVTEESVTSAQVAYQKAQDSLANLEKTRDQELENLRTTAIDTLENKLSVSQRALDVVYDAIADGDAAGNLYVTDVIGLTNAKNDYQSAKFSYDQAAASINTASLSRKQDDILAAADVLKNNLQQTLSAVNGAYDVMANTVVNAYYTTTLIDTLKTSLNTQSTAVSTAITSVQTDAGNLRTKDLYYKTQINDYQNNVSSALASLNLAKAQLDLKQAPARDFDVQAARARVARAQATLNMYLSEFAKTIIKAPVDGTITKVNFEVGEQTSMSQPVISMIGVSNMEIKVDVPESDIVKLEVGDPVEITLDAFSSDEKFAGTVTFIDPASTLINGVVYYQVTVNFNNKDERIKSGMTANLTISTDSRAGVLIVPSRAVIYRDDKKYIQLLLEKNILSEVEVTTGLRGDGGMVEILSGIKEGDQVVTFIKNNNKK